MSQDHRGRERHITKRQRRSKDSQHSLTPSRPTRPNTTSPFNTTEEERLARCEALTQQMRIMKAQLPMILKRFSKISDPRQTRKIKYQLNSLLLYGILLFVYHYGSRRQANGEMTNPQFRENLHEFFPELEQLPHADTLYRLLNRIEVESLQDALIDWLRHLIKRKKFRRYLINNCFPIAIDGTQKLSENRLWCEQLLQQKKSKTSASDTSSEPACNEYQYSVTVLEANLAFQNGMVIPLLTEFLDYQEGDPTNNTQDCELSAFKRLAKRLKACFPKLPIMLLLDGLYANGPVMACCLENRWQFMVVLKDQSLPSVWEEFHSLRVLPANENHQHRQRWGNRQQHFTWVNAIDYYYGANDRHCITIHVVVCEEQWQETNPQGELITKSSRHAWLSSRPLNSNNVHDRCNLGARHRWGIEECILVEKHQGYSYEHCFAQSWNALKGFHYLMRIAHAFNTLTRFSQALKQYFKRYGVRGFIVFVRDTLKAPWLNHYPTSTELMRPFRLQLE